LIPETGIVRAFCFFYQFWSACSLWRWLAFAGLEFDNETQEESLGLVSNSPELDYLVGIEKQSLFFHELLCH